MVNALPFLYQYSVSLLNLFSSKDAAQLESLHQDLQDPTSRQSKRLDALLEGFMLNRKHYGDDAPIDPNMVVRAIIGLGQADELPQGACRPDAVLYMANLAQYLSIIYASNEQSEDVRQILSSMFNHFPALFGPIVDAEAKLSAHDSSDLLVRETFLLVLEIRSQYLLRQVSEKSNHAGFDPDEMLRAVFYDGNDGLRGVDYGNQFGT